MLSALDAEESKLDESERKFVSTIREHGWFNTHILASEEMPGFNFTTGFQVNLGVPEIIVFGLRDQVAHGLLWNFYRDLKAGKRYETGQPYADFLEGFEICFQVVDKSQYHNHLGWSRWFYAGDEFDCWQLIWPDKLGKFPWEANFNPNLLDLQPDLSAGHWGGKILN
ncbi:MAG: DUF4262 domain-containing protein [Asticcacaulis sp.]|nr:DUF4262 domain-containing protein [Asticcacaulis sp.]